MIFLNDFFPFSESYKPLRIDSPFEYEKMILKNDLKVDLKSYNTITFENFRPVACAFTASVPNYCSLVRSFCEELTRHRRFFGRFENNGVTGREGRHDVSIR